AGPAVPGVQLVGAGGVGHEQRTVGGVLRPLGEGHSGGPESLLPVGHLGGGGGVWLSHGAILPARRDIAPPPPPGLWTTFASPPGPPRFPAGGCPVPLWCV